MPPAKRTTVLDVRGDYEVGDLLNIVIDGKLVYKNAELLNHSQTYIKIRGSLQVAPYTEIVMIPWAAIQGFGVVGER